MIYKETGYIILNWSLTNLELGKEIMFILFHKRSVYFLFILVHVSKCLGCADLQNLAKSIDHVANIT